MSSRDRRISKELRKTREWYAMIDRASETGTTSAASENTGRAPLPTFIIRAFEAFRLNPKKSEDWELLLWDLASVLFPEPGRRKGSRKIWDKSRLDQLSLDFQKIKKRFPDFSDSAICEKIVAHGTIGASYRARNQSAQTLRRNLKAARNSNLTMPRRSRTRT